MNILDIVFPKICVGCKREGEYICGDCRKRLVVPEAICPMCCNPSLDGWTHPRCRKWGGMERLIVGLSYRGIVQQCLKKVKYKSAWEIIEFLYGLCNFEDIRDGVITSVPMWKAKERMRGFNQADMVAELVAKSLPGDSRQVAILERVRETKPHYKLNKEQRTLNIEGAFGISKQLTANGIQQSRVILVDDVWTTGATMRECAKVLKTAGFESVWGITLAR